MTATYIFWICIGIVAAIVVCDFCKKCKKVIPTKEENDPQNEEIKFQYYFKHPSGRTFSKGMNEEDAIEFAKKHPYWYVTVSNGVDLINSYWESPKDYWNFYE